MGEDEKASPTGPSRPKRARISQNTNAKPKQVQAAEMKQKVAQALLKQKKENEPVLLKWDKEQWEAWKTCEKASAVLDTAFLALKTPLSTIYEAEVGEEHIFTVDMFAQEETKAGRFCAMVVNAVADQKEYLYNTKEIYDDWDMTLEPLPIEDDQKNELDPQLFRFVAPSRAQVQNFIRTVRNQLEDDPLSKIGVVSTFGYNRVGVLIISYLVEAKQMSLLDALALFAKSRPPGVYSKSCLLALQRRYALNVSVPVPAAPVHTRKTVYCF